MVRRARAPFSGAPRVGPWPFHLTPAPERLSNTYTMNIHDCAEERRCSTRRVIDFTSLSNPLGPSGQARHAMRKALGQVHAAPRSLTRHLRRANREEGPRGAVDVFFGHGSAMILDLICRQSNRGSVLVPSLHPPHHASLLESRGVCLVPFLQGQGPAFLFSMPPPSPRHPRAPHGPHRQSPPGHRRRHRARRPQRDH
jgi:hypothetical protein